MTIYRPTNGQNTSCDKMPNTYDKIKHVKKIELTFLLSINMRKNWDFSLFSSFQSFLCAVFCRILGKKLSGQSLRIMLFSPKQGLASNKASCCKVSWFFGQKSSHFNQFEKITKCFELLSKKTLFCAFQVQILYLEWELYHLTDDDDHRVSKRKRQMLS